MYDKPSERLGHCSSFIQFTSLPARSLALFHRSLLNKYYNCMFDLHTDLWTRAKTNGDTFLSKFEYGLTQYFPFNSE